MFETVLFEDETLDGTSSGDIEFSIVFEFMGRGGRPGPVFRSEIVASTSTSCDDATKQ